jgi:hypothetical protein
VAHPRANGQVERANGLILDGFKKRLYDENNKKGSKWIDEISSVVRGLRIQPSKATGQSPFFLVYGSEAILPAEVMWKSPRLEMFEEGDADTVRHLELDSIEEIKCNVLIQLARYLQGVLRYHDRNIQDALSMLEIWFFDESRMVPGSTSLTCEGKGLSFCTRLHALDLIAYSTLIARRFLILGISSIYAIFILDQLGTSSIGAWRLILTVQLRFTSLRLILRASLLKGPYSYFQ